MLRLRLLIPLLIAPLLVAQSPNLTGDWIITITRYGEPELHRIKIDSKDNAYSFKLTGLTLTGTISGSKVEFKCSYKEDEQTKACGTMTGTAAPDQLSGSGRVFDEDLTWKAVRDNPTSVPPQKREFVATKFQRQFNGNIAPVLHINPGDTIHTRTVDAGGVDEKGVHRSRGGNPLNGPFYIDGALPGDTIAIHLDRVRLDRDSAGIYNDSVVYSAVDPYYAHDMKPTKDFDSSWKLDTEAGYAQLTKPDDRLKNLRVTVHPMMGCIGVAPQGHQAYASGNLGRYGGNMDYNQIREGTTVYLPVFQEGALLFIGDGHALQGDGELTGNALETSMDVEFTVNLIRNKSLGQPRFENGEYVMVSGIAGSLNDALQMATTGLSRWLEEEYKLNVSDIAMLLATSMRYDIAEVVDPQVHVVAKIPKSVLAQITSPAKSTN
jgi:acetamidase/formamidase